MSKLTKFDVLSPQEEDRPRYDLAAMTLHWLVAALIIWAFAMGWIMTDIPGFSPTKLRYYSWHKWIGVTVLTLVLVRLIWRATHQPPALPADTTKLMSAAAHGAHMLLYVLMIAVPVSGYLYTAVVGIQVVYLGVLPLPTILSPHPEWRAVARNVHVWLNWTLASIVVLHLLAVVKHTLVDRDGLLSRMLPFGS